MTIDDFIEFFTQSVFMIPLLLCSVVAIAVALYRFLMLRRSAVMPQPLLEALENGKGEAEMRRLVEKYPSPLGTIARTALLENHTSRLDASQATEARAREEVIQMQTGLSVLEVIITIAPLLGLLGTVSGLVTVFSTLGAGGAVDSASGGGIPKGISEALITTIAGLSVAIPAVVAHSYLQRRIERLAVRMEVVLQSALQRAYPQ